MVFVSVSRRATWQSSSRHTGRLELITADAASLLVGAVYELQHGSHGVLVARVDVQQDTLQSHVLVQGGISVLGSTGSGQAQELGQDQKAVMLDLLDVGGSLFGGGDQGIGLLLLELLGKLLLQLGLVGGTTRAVLVVNLFVLGERLLELGELGLELGLLHGLLLLVRVDDLGSDELVEGLALVLLDDDKGLGAVGLVERGGVRRLLVFPGCYPPRARDRLTIFLERFRIFLDAAQVRQRVHMERLGRVEVRRTSGSP
jgi:hypothetical protein